MRTLVRNSWYVVAYSDEVGRCQPLGRVAVGQPLVLFRTLEGKAVALQDRCAHRRMPLSKGRITEQDTLVCPYHGLTFDTRGVCVMVPGQATPGDICIRSFPVEERAGLVWVWTGERELADPNRIPDLSWLDRPGWNTTRLYRHANANYLLLNDNLADLLHVAYLHIPSGGGNEAMGLAEAKLKIEGDGYQFVRETKNIAAPASYGRLSAAKGNIDRWHIADFKAPSYYRIFTGVAETGTGGPDSTLPIGRGRWTIAPHHFVTPETESTTHYFQVVGHEWPSSSDSWRFLNSVIDEDVWAIEHQQKNIDLEPDAPTRHIPSDGPMIAMRRIVERMVALESG